MRKVLLVLGGLAVCAAVLGGVWWGYGRNHGWSIVRKINTSTDRYPLMGMVYKSIPGTLLVSSNKPGVRPFYAPITDRTRYQNEGYTINEIPGQTKAMDYFQGEFVSWETFSGSADLIIVMKDANGAVYKFRTVMAEMPAWPGNMTVLEANGKKYTLTKMTVNERAAVFSPGKKLILIPGFFVPEGEKRDELGNIYVTYILVP